MGLLKAIGKLLKPEEPPRNTASVSYKEWYEYPDDYYLPNGEHWIVCGKWVSSVQEAKDAVKNYEKFHGKDVV